MKIKESVSLNVLMKHEIRHPVLSTLVESHI